MNWFTKTIMIIWACVLVFGGVDLGFTLLKQFSTANTLIGKIGLIGLFILLASVIIFFLVVVIVNIKDLDKKR